MRTGTIALSHLISFTGCPTQLQALYILSPQAHPLAPLEHYLYRRHHRRSIMLCHASVTSAMCTARALILYIFQGVLVLAIVTTCPNNTRVFSAYFSHWVLLTSALETHQGTSLIIPQAPNIPISSCIIRKRRLRTSAY